MMAGEISLNGNIHAISGILPMIIRAREEKCRFCVVPAENLKEARLIPDMKVIGVRNLNEMIQYLRDPGRLLYGGYRKYSGRKYGKNRFL